MKKAVLRIGSKTAEAYEIPLGPVSLVFAHTDTGLLACGAFDVMALDRFSYPAARVTGVATVEELLAGKVKDANEQAKKRGVQPGLSGKDALEKM